MRYYMRGISFFSSLNRRIYFIKWIKIIAFHLMSIAVSTGQGACSFWRSFRGSGQDLQNKGNSCQRFAPKPWKNHLYTSK
jgi:hypothetical protein